MTRVLCLTCKHFYRLPTVSPETGNVYYKNADDVCPYKRHFHTVCDDYTPNADIPRLSHIIRAVEEVSEAHSIRATEIGDKYLISFLIPNPKKDCKCAGDCKCRGGEE